MQQIINAQKGQSMQDLCLMTYGTLDSLVKLCIDNRIDDVNYKPYSGQPFIYTSTDVFNQQKELIKQSTANN